MLRQKPRTSVEPGNSALTPTTAIGGEAASRCSLWLLIDRFDPYRTDVQSCLCTGTKTHGAQNCDDLVWCCRRAEKGPRRTESETPCYCNGRGRKLNAAAGIGAP